LKNNKILVIMMIVAVILTISISWISAIKFENVEIIQLANIEENEKNNMIKIVEDLDETEKLGKLEESENVENSVIDNSEIKDEEKTKENEKMETTENQNTENSQESNYQNIQEQRTASIVKNGVVSSRSQIDRVSSKIYVNTNPELDNNETEEYTEIKEYIKREDLKISFDMDVSKPCGLSREDFIDLVQNMKCDSTGILAKNAGCIWDLCQKYNVNEIFILGICGIESAWCTAPQHQNTHNYSSLMTGGHLIPYETDEQGFEAMISLLGQKYLTPGASFYHGSTITGVGRCYCNPNSWPTKVYTCMQQALK